MESSTCLIRLENPVLESLSFFTHHAVYTLLCRFVSRGKLRHAVVQLSEDQWTEFTYSRSTSEAHDLQCLLDRLKQKERWVHVNLRHQFPNLSQITDTRFILDSQLNGQSKTELKLVAVEQNFRAA